MRRTASLGIFRAAETDAVVVPGCWHHVTQRRNPQQMVFSRDSERKFYLDLLQHHCSRHYGPKARVMDATEQLEFGVA